MTDIKALKNEEMQEVIDFYHFIDEYGHIFHDDPAVLDEPFRKIVEGINEVRQIIDNNYSR